MTSSLSCRFCDTPLAHSFCDLGYTPLANSYIPADKITLPEPSYPLHARVCSKCYLVQVESVVPAEDIFSHYAYFSSFSSSWVAHARAFTEKMISRFGLNSTSHVVEVASNDGYLLKHFVERTIPCLGIEPAANVAEAAINAGVPTEVRFFGLNTAQDLVKRGWSADLVVANNVLAHVPDLNDFVSGLSNLLAPSGVLSVECPHLLKLIEETQFDTIYHEHYCYYSLLALETIFAKHGMVIFDIEELPTHGGSLRILAERKDNPAPRGISQAVLAVRAKEHAAGLDNIESYQHFNAKIAHVCEDLKSFLHTQQQAGKTVVAYGAAAKGNTLLNVCKVNSTHIPYVVDKNPAKQNHYLPGSHIPIFGPDKIRATKPDFVLILPWNLAKEISQEMADIAQWGGKFVTAIPTLRIFTTPLAHEVGEGSGVREYHTTANRA